MLEPPKCPTPKCPEQHNPMPLTGPRRHDKRDHITRYACPVCAHEITTRTA